MRIYTRAGDLAFKTFTFSDGQPHFKLETYEREFDTVTIETAIKGPMELFTLVLAVSVLRASGYANINLDIRYLLGARMDRAIDWSQPFTLDVVARILNSCGFSKIRILDAHSEVATKLIKNSTNVLPYNVVKTIYTSLGGNPAVASPDKGAADRVREIDKYLKPAHWLISCYKKRDPETGVLSGFGVSDYDHVIHGETVLIVDDICDGGGTFIGLAKELRKAGAKKVNLFVTHGIFSKGLPLEGIDRIYTTDSLQNRLPGNWENVVIVPISMKDL